MRHRLLRELVGDDLGTLAAFVAVAMVAIVMRVDDGLDLRRRDRLGLAHRREHLARQRHVEERVDDERFALIDDEARIRPAPAAIGLKPGIGAIAQVVKTLCVLVAAEA